MILILVNVCIVLIYCILKYIRLNLLEKSLLVGNHNEISGGEVLKRSLDDEGIYDLEILGYEVEGESELSKFEEGVEYELDKKEYKSILKIKNKIKRVNKSLDPFCDIEKREIRLSSRILDYTNLGGLVVSLFFGQYIKRSKNVIEYYQIKYYENKKLMFLIICSSVILTSAGFLGTFINLLALLVLVSMGAVYISKAFMEMFIRKDLFDYINEIKYLDDSELEDFNKYLSIYMSNTYIIIFIIFLFVISRGVSMLF